jgi:hypothetical protein
VKKIVFVLYFATSFTAVACRGQVSDCIYGNWWEAIAEHEPIPGALVWTITVGPSGRDIILRRAFDGLSGTFAFSTRQRGRAPTFYIGSLHSALGNPGPSFTNVTLIRESCTVLKTDKGWWLRRPAPAAPMRYTITEPEWQIDASWCLHDNGSSGTAYQTSCTHGDQYAAILACQRHNAKATLAIKTAGQEAVNAYMAKIQPGFCQRLGQIPPPPPTVDYYVVWKYSCQYADGRSAGDCTITQHSSVSCQDAQNAIVKRALSSDVCKKCADVTDNSKHVIPGPPQRITGGGPCSGQ